MKLNTQIKTSLPLAAAMGSLILAAGSANAASIFYESFESPDEYQGGAGTAYGNVVATGWSGAPINTNGAGDINTPYGNQVAWTNDSTGTGGPLSDAFLIGNLQVGTYTLTFNVSARVGSATYIGALLAGGDVIGQTVATAVNNTDMSHFSTPIVVNVTAVHANLGQDIQIRLSATDIQPQFDNVNLDFVAVPEPSTTALLGLGGLALILRRRK
jgi:hypothetical protein